MGTPTETVKEAHALLLSALADSNAQMLHHDALLEFTAAAEAAGRVVDALRIKAAGEVAFHSRPELGDDRLSAKKGCRNGVELLARITLSSERTLTQRMRLGEATRARVALSGESMPARFDQVAFALGTGSIGYDSAAAIIDTLDPIRGRVGDLNVEHAETALVAAATGPTVESPLPFAADEVRGQARVWETVLDEDGVVPAEERAMQARGISAGITRDGVVHRKMTLLPEIDAKFETLMNAYLNPRSKPTFENPDPDAPRDPRATAQARHDVFASLIDGAARSADSPTIGGAAPTVLVSVRQADLDAGTGSGFIEGCEAPISMRAVEQFICAGGQQHVVIGPDGTINAIGNNDRLFNATQRRAISLRDGGCIIPGCSIPAAWSEIHHVKEHQNGGENGNLQRCAALLVPPPQHRDQRLADPNGQRGPTRETPALAPRRTVRRRHPLATIHQIPHPTSRPPPRQPPAGRVIRPDPGDPIRSDAQGFGGGLVPRLLPRASVGAHVGLSARRENTRGSSARREVARWLERAAPRRRSSDAREAPSGPAGTAATPSTLVE